MGSKANEMGSTKGDDWKALAAEYQKTTSEVSIRPITVMLERSNALFPFSKAAGVLDNGCGPGPVMKNLLKTYQLPASATLTCSDFSEAMVEQVKKNKQKAVEEDSQSPWARVSTELQDAMDLKSVADSSVSHVTAGWVYFMLPDPHKALSESLRVLQDEGVLACSAWQGSQWLDLMNLVPRVRPDKKLPVMPKEWTDVNLMKVELEKAGFRDVESHQVPVEMKFEKLEDIVEFFIGKLPHMVQLTKDFSEEDMAKLKEVMVEEGRKFTKAQGNRFTGTSLVAIGRK